ncbi:hypothetical protein Ocin01_17055, partial [Orchesella cincta]
MSHYSGDRDNDDEDSYQILEYKCKKCKDNRTFTRAELEAHRAVHKAEKRGKENKGAQSSGFSKAPSTTSSASEVTLFEEISTPPKETPKTRVNKRSKSKAKSPVSSAASEREEDLLVSSQLAQFIPPRPPVRESGV